jgi:uncharacterized protein (DUF1501 family)
MKQDRRDFLVKSCAALSMGAVATQMRHFGMMSVQAQKKIDESPELFVPSDYRALVCIFLSGGNDSNNMIIPNHNDTTISNYSVYNAARTTQGLAIAQSALANTAISVPRMGGLSYALHPNLRRDTATQPINGTSIVNDGIHDLWASGKLAVVANVGTLTAPMTRTTYLNNSVKKPYQLFSHSDQTNQYQGGRSDIASFTGWAGRAADLRNALDNPIGLIPMVTSIAGAQLFTSGQTTLPLGIADANTSLANVLNPAGFANNAAGNARKAAFNALRGIDLSSNVVAAASHITDSAIAANTALQTSQEVTVTFPNTGLGRQLKQVARLIKTRTGLQVNRQVFYVQIGGFDTHNFQIGDQANLMTQLSQAMRAFYEEMVAQGIGDKVTQFTMADFSRTLAPNGTPSDAGTDHGWGSHQFVVGGGLTASDFYGGNGANGTPFPQLTVNAADDSDNGSGARGRWVPATSVEQYGATLARWFGVPDANLVNVFPKIGNWTNTNLGFMQPPAP